VPSLFLLILGAIGLSIWVLLERREKARVDNNLPRLAGWRLVIAAAAAIVMLFSGGCSLIFMAELFQGMGQQYFDIWVVLIVGGIPFLVGLLIWWLALRRGRADGS
jgi:hypothetical protein